MEDDYTKKNIDFQQGDLEVLPNELLVMILCEHLDQRDLYFFYVNQLAAIRRVCRFFNHAFHMLSENRRWYYDTRRTQYYKDIGRLISLSIPGFENGSLMAMYCMSKFGGSASQVMDGIYSTLTTNNGFFSHDHRT